MVANDLEYILKKFECEGYAFQDIVYPIKENVNDEDIKKIEYLKARFYLTYPDIKEINILRDKGIIKEILWTPVANKLIDSTKSALDTAISKIEYSVSQNLKYKRRIFISRESFTIQESNNNIRIEEISMDFILKDNDISLKEVVAFLGLIFNKKELSYCSEINFSLLKKQKNQRNYQKVLSTSLDKKPLIEFKKFVTLANKEEIFSLYREPDYMKALFTFIFPYNDSDTVAEVTLDVMKENEPPIKIRRVNFEGLYDYFHNIIHRNMTIEQFSRLMTENLINGVYVSVRSTSEDVLYIIIDIDVQDYIKSVFDPQIIHSFLIDVITSIQKILEELGLPVANVNFSASRGFHFVLAIQKGAIEDFEGKVNLTNFYLYSDFYPQVPFYFKLKRKFGSLIRDKFKMVKTLAQAICLKLIYHSDLRVPKEFLKVLKIDSRYKLLTLSVDSLKAFSILLDTSSNGKGVIRIYGAHPATGLVSIPVYNTKKKTLIEEAKNYLDLRAKATITSVISDFKKNQASLFFQKPNKISRKQFQQLLLPDKLIPYVCILLRFDTIEAAQLSESSFRFWHRFYQLQAFYNYMYNLLLNFNSRTENPDKLISELESLANDLAITDSGRILELLKQHLILKTLEFPLLIERLSSSFFTELFFKLLKKKLTKKNQEDLLILFSDEIEFSRFIKEVESHFYILANELSELVLKTDQSEDESKIEALSDFLEKLNFLFEIGKEELKKIKAAAKDKTLEEVKKLRLITSLHFTIKIYFAVTEFLSNCFNNSLNNQEE